MTAWRDRLVKETAREVAANVAMAFPQVRAWRLKRPRAGEPFSERYAFQAVRGIEDVIGPIAGNTVVEFGPGDTLGAGLSMLAAGASSYTALDRFVPNYSSAAARKWYRAIRAGWDDAFPDRRWPADLDPERFPEAYPARVKVLRASVEDVRTTEQFDVVTSWQVGEHVLDVQSFADRTAALLRQDGVAIHRVDFGPHSWAWHQDPLVFLRFAPPLWRLMGSNRGLPNRARHHEFMSAWARAGLRVECRDLGSFDESEIAFDRLHPAFRSMPRSSLLVRDVVYVCRPG